LDEEQDPMRLLLGGVLGYFEGLERVHFVKGRLVLWFQFVNKLGELFLGGGSCPCGFLHFGF
jgi:hypothetical protein